MSEYIEIDGYSYWASYLVNGEIKGYTPSELAECRAWLDHHGVLADDIIDARGDTFFDYPDGPVGLRGDCVTYAFLKK